jgi:GTPase SAR1 family protein
MHEVDAAYAELSAICHELLGFADIATVSADVRAAAQMLSNVPPLRVVACGEFGRGKSTLLGSIAGRRLFPQAPNDTTSVATTLVWGEADDAVVCYTGPNGSPGQKAIRLDQVSKYVTQLGKPDVPGTVLEVKMRAPLETLAWGLELVDTPGVNSRFPTHNLNTEQQLKTAGIILLVASTDGPLNTREIDAFEKAAETGAPLIAVLTKTDDHDPAVLIRDTAEKLSHRLHRPVEVLGVSAEDALTGQEDNDEYLVGQSQVPKLYQQITAFGAAHRSRYALYGMDTARSPHDREPSPVALLSTALATLRGSREHERAEIRAAQDSEQALVRANEVAQRRLADLQDAAGQLTQEVQSQTAGMVADIQQDVVRRCHDLAEKYAARAADLTTIKSAEYQDSLLRRLGEIANSANTKLNGFLISAVSEVRRATGLELSDLPAGPGPTVQTDAAGALPGHRARFNFDAIRQGVRDSKQTTALGTAIGSTFGGLVGAVPGAVVGGAVGALIGQVAGAVGGIQEAMQKAERRDLAVTARWQTEEAAEGISKWLDATAPDRIETLLKATDDLITQRRAQLHLAQRQAALNAANAALRPIRLKELTAQLGTLDRLDASLARASGSLLAQHAGRSR